MDKEDLQYEKLKLSMIAYKMVRYENRSKQKINKYKDQHSCKIYEYNCTICQLLNHLTESVNISGVIRDNIRQSKEHLEYAIEELSNLS